MDLSKDYYLEIILILVVRSLILPHSMIAYLYILRITSFGIYRTCAIISRSWLQAIHKDRIFLKNLLKNKEMVFENGVKNIQAALIMARVQYFVFDSSAP
jgi:hypothetical protein